MSLQGPHFSLQSRGKTIYKSTNLSKIGISGIAFTSVYSEKCRLKKFMNMIIIITSNRNHLLLNEKWICKDG